MSSVPDLTRLPSCVVPKRYELKLNVDPDERKYTGKVNCRIFVQDDPPSHIIWIHSKNLEIGSVSIQLSQFSMPVPALEIIEVPEKSCIGLAFDPKSVNLSKGTRAWLLITFAAKLSQNLEGFFSNPYKDQAGNIRNGAATMFAATEARSCFPCFDEPHLKAVFAIEVTVSRELMVISNMPIMDSEPVGNDKRKDTFEWTKEMSTYLVCIVIGQYDYVQTKANNRTIVRVYTPYGQREQGRFSLQVAKKCLEFFNVYFAKRYSLPKLDLLALRYLSVGAMENWGLITCRENAIIVPENATPSALQRVAMLIAHEISHQWFGNLVTMKWWDFLYLNEGFATFMQYLCINALFPDFDVFNEFSTETFVPALGMDALKHSHPVEVPLKNPSEISQVFDKITYCKGASVIYMLHEYIGPEKFRAGIREYIQTFSYGNADTEDLWQFLSKSAGIDVASLMNTWIKEMGFPVVAVSTTMSPNGEVALKLSQHRFSGTSDSSGKASPPMLWSIPVQGIYMKNGITLTHFEVLFDKKSIIIELEGIDLKDLNCFVKLNPRLTGFYRVHYSENLFDNLFHNLSSNHLTSVDRMGLFDDQVAMVQTDSGSTVRLLQMAQHFSQYERSYIIWKAVIGILHLIRSLTWDLDEVADKIDHFCMKILKPFMDELGYHSRKGESNSDRQCRASIFGYMASLRDSDVQNAAKNMFKHHVDGSRPIEASMRDAVYKGVMTTVDNRQLVNQMKSLYRNADLAEERNRILHAMGYCQNPDTVEVVLDFALSPEVPPQDSVLAVASLASNRYAYKQTWHFFANNIEKISKRYAGGLFLMSRIIKAVTDNFSSMDKWREISDVFAENREHLVGAETAMDQAIERVRLNASWRAKDLDNLRQFLQSDMCDKI